VLVRVLVTSDFCCALVKKMYSNSELVDMLLIYGEVGLNAVFAARLYTKRYPGRRQPDRRMFITVTQRLRDTDNLRRNNGRDGGGQRLHHNIEDEVLDLVHANPEISSRGVSRIVGKISHTSVLKILHKNDYHPYHFQRVQGLMPADHQARTIFCQWILQQHAAHFNFTSRIIFSDEAIFTRDGVHNFHNMHYWAQENPHVVVRSSLQHRFSLNVWAGILNGNLLGPYILPTRLNGDHYLEFLQNVLPVLLEDVPLLHRQHAWFQHDGAPPHFSRNVRQHLNNTYGNRWIGRGGPVSWPPRSPDLNPLDFYLWGHFKSLVYDNQNPPETVEELRMRIQNCAEIIKQENHMNLACSVSLIQRSALCVAVGGDNFEQYL